MPFKVSYEKTNLGQTPLSLWVEPWCYEHEIAPGQSVRLMVESAFEGDLEIEETAEKITIFGWQGCTIKVYLDDELDFERNYAVPKTPAAMNIRDLVKMLFG